MKDQLANSLCLSSFPRKSIGSVTCIPEGSLFIGIGNFVFNEFFILFEGIGLILVLLSLHLI